MFLISIPYFLLRFPAKICPPTRRNKLVIVIRTTQEKDVKFVSNARLFLNLILLLPHGGGEQIFTIYGHLFYYLLQQSREVGIPSCLLIHVRASGTLVTLKETGGTGSTLRTVETRWTFTATWQLTEVRSTPKKSEIVSNYSSFKLLLRFWLTYIPRLILYKQLPLSNLKTFNVNCTDIVRERDSRRCSSSFFFFLAIPLFGQDCIGYGFQGNTSLLI